MTLISEKIRKIASEIKKPFHGDAFNFVIRVRGLTLDTGFIQCHEKCQWLSRDQDNTPSCLLFRTEEMIYTRDNEKIPTRTESCISAVEGLI